MIRLGLYAFQPGGQALCLFWGRYQALSQSVSMLHCKTSIIVVILNNSCHTDSNLFIDRPIDQKNHFLYMLKSNRLIDVEIGYGYTKRIQTKIQTKITLKKFQPTCEYVQKKVRLSKQTAFSEWRKRNLRLITSLLIIQIRQVPVQTLYSWNLDEV